MKAEGKCRSECQDSAGTPGTSVPWRLPHARRRDTLECLRTQDGPMQLRGGCAVHGKQLGGPSEEFCGTRRAESDADDHPMRAWPRR